jgi:ElaB/YqjD/DUF883 family membrane-anchored ribosome-binding protein
MSEPQNTHDDLGDELRALGATLRDMLQAAWESDERKRAQQEIETGLEDLARMLRSAGQEFSASPTGQRLKADVHELHERVRASQVDDQVRQELVAALRRVNEELGKAARAWAAKGGDAPKPESQAGKSEEPS